MAYISVSLNTKAELKFENSDSSQSTNDLNKNTEKYSNSTLEFMTSTLVHCKIVSDEQAVIRAAAGVKRNRLLFIFSPDVFRNVFQHCKLILKSSNI